MVSACRKGSAVEILSSACGGGTTLCLHAALRFLLPSIWEGISIGGLDGVCMRLCMYLPPRLPFLQGSHNVKATHQEPWHCSWEMQTHSEPPVIERHHQMWAKGCASAGRVYFVDGNGLFDMIRMLSMLMDHLRAILPEKQHSAWILS